MSYKIMNKLDNTDLLSKKNELKERGQKVVKKQLTENWNTLIDNMFLTQKQAMYSYTIIESALQCMEKLSQESELIEACSLIDYQNPNSSIILDSKESKMRTIHALKIVQAYHDRGQELYDKYINNLIESKEPGSSHKM